MERKVLKMVTTSSIAEVRIPEETGEFSIAMLKSMGEDERAKSLQRVIGSLIAKIRPEGKYLITKGRPMALVDGDSGGQSCFGKIDELRYRIVATDDTSGRALIINNSAGLAVAELHPATCKFMNEAFPHGHLLLDAYASWDTFQIGLIVNSLCKIVDEQMEAKRKWMAALARLDRFTRGAKKLLEER